MGRFKALRPHKIGVQVQTPTVKRKTALRNRGRKRVKNYRVRHGLCEVCQYEGRYRWADHVHHIDGIAEAAQSMQDITSLGDALHEDGKMLSVCKDCHEAIHAGKIDQDTIDRIKGDDLGEGVGG